MISKYKKIQVVVKTLCLSAARGAFGSSSGFAVLGGEDLISSACTVGLHNTSVCYTTERSCRELGKIPDVRLEAAGESPGPGLYAALSSLLFALIGTSQGSELFTYPE